MGACPGLGPQEFYAYQVPTLPYFWVSATLTRKLLKRGYVRRDATLLPSAAAAPYGSSPNTVSSFWVPTYTFPFATMGTVNLMAPPGWSRLPA